MVRVLRFVSVLAVLLANPAHAAEGFGMGEVILYSNNFMKIFMILLAESSLAAVAVAGIKLTSGARLTGGSAFLSALRLGGPLIGLLGATYIAFSGFLAVAQVGHSSLAMWSPALAEATLLLMLGLLSGVVAVIGHWAVEARIDRAVLQS